MPRWVRLVRKDCFIENNVAGDNDAAGGEVIASVPFVLKGITQKNTAGGTWGELVGGCGIGVGKTQAPEDAKMIISGMNAM